MIKRLTMLRFPEGKEKAVTLSYDDGVKTDQRLISIMDCYGLKGTFNINSELFSEEGTDNPDPTRRMTYSEVVDTYLNSGHEVAVHGLNHGFFSFMEKNVANYEIAEDRRRLEAMTGGIVRGMAYPFGQYDDNLLDILRTNDIVYSRTVNSHGTFELPKNFLVWDPTCHHNDEHLFELVESFLHEELKMPWRAEGRLFYLWGHSYEFERHNNWNVIESFAEKIGGKADIWYATNIEIYDYLTAYRNLVFNVKQTRVYNPSAIPIWMTSNLWNGGDVQTLCVHPGETIELPQ